MKKKFFAMVMAGVMAVSVLAGCGSNNADTSNGSASDAGSGSESVQTFKIGTIGPLSGPYAIYGQAVANGTQIAVDEINAMGGDFKFELSAQDDEGDGEKSVNAYNNLMDWGMQVLVGPTTTGASVAVAAKCFEERTFMLTPSASSVDVTAGKDNVFQVCFTDPNQGAGSADYIAEHFAGESVAVIYQNDNAYSQGIRDTFAAEASAKGVNIVSETTFTADTASDFSVQINAAKSAGATVMFLPIYYQEASIILKQSQAAGYAPTFFGVDGMDGILTMEGFDASLAEGVMLLTPFSADAADERTQTFVSEYQAKYGETPNQFAADAYDGVYIVYEALKAAGCTADMSTADICEAIVGVMTTISVDGLTGQGMTWNAEGEVAKAPMAVVIKDGVYVTPEN